MVVVVEACLTTFPSLCPAATVVGPPRMLVVVAGLVFWSAESLIVLCWVAILMDECMIYKLNEVDLLY